MSKQRAKKKVFVFLFAVIACAFAIPAAVPQPLPISAQPFGAQPLRPLENNREVEPIAEGGAEANQDLKASSSYGYGMSLT